MLYMLETLCGDAKRKAFAERELFRVPTPLSHEVGRYLVLSMGEGCGDACVST